MNENALAQLIILQMSSSPYELRELFFKHLCLSVAARRPMIRLKTTKFWRNRRRTGTPTKTLAEDVRLPITQNVNEFHEHAWSATGLDASVCTCRENSKVYDTCLAVLFFTYQRCYR